MGSDFCACENFYPHEKESNALSNSSNNKNLKQNGTQFKKTTEKETLAEDKDNKIQFRDINSNKNDFFEKQTETKTATEQKKGIFNFNQNNNDNYENNIKINKGINNNGEKNNNNDEFVKKQFTFKELSLRTSMEKKIQNDNQKEENKEKRFMRCVLQARRMSKSTSPSSLASTARLPSLTMTTADLMDIPAKE